MKESSRVLYVEKEKLTFQFFSNGQKQDEVVLNAGYQLIADRFFKSNIPTEGETDYAINFIEDELMSNKKLVGDNEGLAILSPIVEEVFRKYAINQPTIQRQEIEDLFSLAARVVMSRHLPEGLELNSVNFAVILLLREISHHLKFTHITFTTESL
ncbi:hypothetical protein [uncultured Acetobacteroides sp.]|uniref:hypothetical protein n=1 Tax=uncultured Acetobacteroides sp. TaxID=1760811 RepID=UPI0029F50B59|nr:hypothetical protein [uncultured Acetobacteroides sp.]